MKFAKIQTEELSVSNSETVTVPVKPNSGRLCVLMDYVHVTGVTVEGHRASHRLPAADKKCKHTLKNTSTLELMKGQW